MFKRIFLTAVLIASSIAHQCGCDLFDVLNNCIDKRTRVVKDFSDHARIIGKYCSRECTLAQARQFACLPNKCPEVVAMFDTPIKRTYENGNDPKYLAPRLAFQCLKDQTDGKFCQTKLLEHIGETKGMNAMSIMGSLSKGEKLGDIPESFHCTPCGIQYGALLAISQDVDEEKGLPVSDLQPNSEAMTAYQAANCLQEVKDERDKLQPEIDALARDIKGAVG
eukprot:TRINITY_DN46170_c0_g1_i1.p1 TRINITY_DN46170_c0_g1~~TRINITY_DN46170_c0_g1_i1.p1  ORF type:complete len:241 (+),score=31.99 TRINITY_DN46170_c0_g1_i1:56-724(+)